MSRVSYAMMHSEGSGQMTTAVRTALNGLSRDAGDEGRDQARRILELALVGNPIMHHLLLGIDPIPLGSRRSRLPPIGPFASGPPSWTSPPIPGAALRPAVHRRARRRRHRRGHPGRGAARGDRGELVVDVGTNAEIVLGNRDFLLAASSPTGPAFEGAQISAGQRAAPGAIERVRIDRDTLEPRFRVIGCDLWSDEPGFDEATADTGVTGICGSGIVEVIAELYLARVITPDGIVDGSLAARTARVFSDGRTFSYLLHDGSAAGRPRIAITQNDVRAIQLAKAALYAGVRLLMDHAGIETLDEIRLAGAFGSQIDTFHAMVLGLYPDADLAHVKSAGNAAGTGALIALLSGAARTEIERVVRTVDKIETAVEPRFQQHFVEAMAFPHLTAAYPHLAQVTLPPRGGVGADAGDGGADPDADAARQWAPTREDR